MLRLLLSISCFLLVGTPSYPASAPCAARQCIAVVDAGSTGSRLHLFAYDVDKSNTPINITELWSKKTKPAFAAVEANQNAINTYISTLFSGAPVQQPVPVYFYATAGMRLIPQTTQKAYYQYLKNWFSNQTNWQLMDAKTITGTDEALYGWLSVNYYLDTLKSSSQHAVGVLDIGGASTQIAFPLKHDSQNMLQGSQIQLTLYGQPIHLFVHSFLGLGQNEMGHQLLDSTSCFANNYPLPNGERGLGSTLECVEEISLLINGLHKVNQVVQPVLSENPTNSWYAIGGIVNLAESKPFEFLNKQLTTQDFLQQANNLTCHQSWEELSRQFPGNEHLDSYCLLPAFYHALMVEGYGFSPDQTIHFMPSSQNVDWTLGVVFYH
jgi:hypothetical protein